jgi:hypothetical protein
VGLSAAYFASIAFSRCLFKRVNVCHLHCCSNIVSSISQASSLGPFFGCIYIENLASGVSNQQPTKALPVRT